MSHNSKKDKEKRGPTWVGYYPRRTKTLKEKMESLEKSIKNL